jgi:hypothetical protein
MVSIKQLKEQLPAILETATGLKKVGSQWEGACPICGGVDRFRVMFDNPHKWFCRNCNSKGGDVIDLHKKMHGFTDNSELAGICQGNGSFSPARRKKEPAKATAQNLKAKYHYKDEQGKILFTVLRYEAKGFKKSFRQGYKDDSGVFHAGVAGRRVVPYKLPELLSSDRVFIVEGEKDVDLILSEGLPATCFQNATWKDEYRKYFSGKEIFVIPDMDKPGGKKANQVARALSGKLLFLPGLAEKGDVSDFFNNGGTVADIENLLSSAKLPIQEQDSLPCEEESFHTEDWPVLSDKAMPGIVGDFIKLATESSEADPAAILLTFLVRFSTEIGGGCYLQIGDTKHRARFAAVIVGGSSKARKGTSASPVKRLFKYSPDLNESLTFIPAETSPGPFSSGEGIVHRIRDKVEEFDKKNQEMVVTDPGTDDKRLFVLDEEFAGVLSVMKRDGNTLSMVIRQLFDSGNIEPLTKSSKQKVTNGHVGWVGHITLTELNAKMEDTEALNGFANRVLWTCARRAGFVSRPKPMGKKRLEVIQKRLFKIILSCQAEKKITFTEETFAIWDSVYPELSKDNPGLVGCMINRAEALTLRLSMLYALLDGSNEIRPKHLESALALWDYCRQSALFIFQAKNQNRDSEKKIIQALREKKEMTGTEINNLFQRHLPGNKLKEILSELTASRKIVQATAKKRGRGRPPTVYKLA